MKITGYRLVRLRIPFKGRFQHAEVSRDASDCLYVELEDEEGRAALGEILARPYVTGETTDGVLDTTGPELGREVRDANIASLDVLDELVSGQRYAAFGAALVGGFEMAVIGLLGQSTPLDFTSFIGPRRQTDPGRCVTIGFEVEFSDLRKSARHALLVGATAVKVKVGRDDDVARLQEVNTNLGGRVHLRLDANGVLSHEAAADLLAGCAAIELHSLEQPFAPDEDNIDKKLSDLTARFGTKFAADESVCTQDDARRWAESGGYQYFNVRVGKCGGLAASARIAKIAREAGLGLLGGAMVGETGVLNAASELLLKHCEAIPYIEGIGQNKFVLAEDPVVPIPAGEPLAFRLRKDLEHTTVISEHKIY